MSELDDKILYEAVYEGKFGSFYYSKSWHYEQINLYNQLENIKDLNSIKNEEVAAKIIEERNYKNEVAQLIKQRNHLAFREKQVLNILPKIKSSILKDNLELFCEEVQSACTEIDNVVNKFRNKVKINDENLYLTSEEREQAKSVLSASILEGVCYYLKHAEHDEKQIIKTLIESSSEALISLDEKQTTAGNVRKFMLEKLDEKWAGKQCFYCNEGLIKNISYCFNCYERNVFEHE